MKLKNLIFTLVVLASTSMFAQFSLSGEFRPRTEWFGHGQKATALEGTKGYLSTSVRAALKTTYKSEGYTLFTSFQEVFKFGDRAQISDAGNGNFRVQEAWADIKLNEALSLKFGRQPLSYDDQRILGGLGWAQQARTHDAGVFKYKKGGYNLDLGFALNTPTSAIFDQAAAFSYREMAFVRANKKYKNLNLSALILSNTYQNGSEDKSSLLTAGVHADLKLNKLTLSANAFLQDGNRLGDVAVEGAYLASLLAKFKATGKTTFKAGFETISGKTDESAAFFPLYGTNHAFNGLMDRFYVGNHGNAGGLNDLQLGVATKISGLAVSLTGHYFTEVEDLDGLGSDLGSELDLVVAKKFKDFKLVGGYSQFFEPSEVVGKDTQNWAWLMLIISPKFL
jgi:hypothetical protein